MQEQAALARKTLGAFGFNAITVNGDVCDELFVPSLPVSAKRDNLLLDDIARMDTPEHVQETFRALAKQERQEQRLQQQEQEEQEQQQQLGVFKVNTRTLYTGTIASEGTTSHGLLVE